MFYIFITKLLFLCLATLKEYVDMVRIIPSAVGVSWFTNGLSSGAAVVVLAFEVDCTGCKFCLLEFVSTHICNFSFMHKLGGLVSTG